jgi:hypothetical protein
MSIRNLSFLGLYDLNLSSWDYLSDRITAFTDYFLSTPIPIPTPTPMKAGELRALTLPGCGKVERGS